MPFVHPHDPSRCFLFPYSRGPPQAGFGRLPQVFAAHQVFPIPHIAQNMSYASLSLLWAHRASKDEHAHCGAAFHIISRFYKSFVNSHCPFRCFLFPHSRGPPEAGFGRWPPGVSCAPSVSYFPHCQDSHLFCYNLQKSQVFPIEVFPAQGGG